MRTLRDTFLLVIAVVAATLAVSCNSDNNGYGISYLSANVGITDFSISENDKLLTNIDSVHFTIDLVGRRIYNADSLPKGTDVSKLVLNISFPAITSAKIHVKDGKLMKDTVIDYGQHPTDTIDCSGSMKLTIVSQSGKNTADYDIKVNVHQMDPDSLYWNRTARRDLPSFGVPDAQKTVSKKGVIYTLIHDQKGFMVASTDNPTGNQWEKQSVTFGFTPQIETFNATEESFYILADDGTLYSSDDALAWNACPAHFHWIYGGYENRILASQRLEDGSYSITEFPQRNQPESAMQAPDGFPVSGTSQMVFYTSKWNSDVQAVIVGGIDKNGEKSGMAWGYDGNTWGQISAGAPLPKVEYPTLFSYYVHSIKPNWSVLQYPVLLTFGGYADGKEEKTMYISYDNGVHWKKADSTLQLPEYIPAAGKMQAFVIEITLSGSRSNDGWNVMPDRKLPAWWIAEPGVNEARGSMEWQCPYVYLFGGSTHNGSLYNNIWRGVINRLSFQPII